MDFEAVRACAIELLVALDDVVRERRHEHHGDVVDGARLALRDATRATRGRDPLTVDHTPSNEVSRRIAHYFNKRLSAVIGKWRRVDDEVVMEAVWYVRHGLTVARPCTIDAAILYDLTEFSSAERFADYRAHIETVRRKIESVR